MQQLLYKECIVKYYLHETINKLNALKIPLRNISVKNIFYSMIIINARDHANMCQFNVIFDVFYFKIHPLYFIN